MDSMQVLLVHAAPSALQQHCQSLPESQIGPFKLEDFQPSSFGALHGQDLLCNHTQHL